MPWYPHQTFRSMMVVACGLGLAPSFPPRAFLPWWLWCYDKGYETIYSLLPSVLVAGTSGDPDAAA